MHREPAGFPFLGPLAQTSWPRAVHSRRFFRFFGFDSQWHSRVRVRVRCLGGAEDALCGLKRVKSLGDGDGVGEGVGEG